MTLEQPRLQIEQLHTWISSVCRRVVLSRAHLKLGASKRRISGGQFGAGAVEVEKEALLVVVISHWPAVISHWPQ
jgi:hypothetical protein